MRVEDMCNKYLCQEVRNALINADITRAEEIRLRVGKNIKINIIRHVENFLLLNSLNVILPNKYTEANINNIPIDL